jgi:hypothetical protein
MRLLLAPLLFFAVVTFGCGARDGLETGAGGSEPASGGGGSGGAATGVPCGALVCSPHEFCCHPCLDANPTAKPVCMADGQSCKLPPSCV